MLRVKNWLAEFDTPLTVVVKFTDTESGATVEHPITAPPTQANAIAAFVPAFKKEIYGIVLGKKWKQTKIRIDEVSLQHPDATGDEEEIDFCTVIKNQLQQPFSAS